MNFDKDIPIYLQIEDFIQDKISSNLWLADERIPSVRDLAATLEVNPNTVMRSYEKLERENIIYNQRGIGYFAVSDALEKIKLKKREYFMTQLNELFKVMQLLEISIPEVELKYQEYLSKTKDYEKK